MNSYVIVFITIITHTWSVTRHSTITSYVPPKILKVLQPPGKFMLGQVLMSQ